MKEFLLTNFELIMTIVTGVVTFVGGYLAKKSKVVNDNRIPIQNITIAIIMMLIYRAITGNWSAVVATGSPVATLLYDLVHNLRKEN